MPGVYVCPGVVGKRPGSWGQTIERNKNLRNVDFVHWTAKLRNLELMIRVCLCKNQPIKQESLRSEPENKLIRALLCMQREKSAELWSHTFFFPSSLRVGYSQKEAHSFGCSSPKASALMQRLMPMHGKMQ